MLKKFPNRKKIDFRRAPYRGTLTAVAEAEGMTLYAVGMAYRRGNPRICMLVAREASRRRAAYDAMVSTADRLLEKATS